MPSPDLSGRKPRPVRIALSADDYHTLVSGGVVRTEQVEIVLSDIGWDKMAELLENAEIAALAQRGTTDIETGHYTTFTSSDDIATAHQETMARILAKLHERPGRK